MWNVPRELRPSDLNLHPEETNNKMTIANAVYVQPHSDRIYAHFTKVCIGFSCPGWTEMSRWDGQGQGKAELRTAGALVCDRRSRKNGTECRHKGVLQFGDLGGRTAKRSVWRESENISVLQWAQKWVSKLKLKWGLVNIALDWMSVSLQNACVRIQVPSVMALGGGAFGKGLGHVGSVPLWRRAFQDTARRRPATTQKRLSQESSPLPILILDFWLQDCEKEISVVDKSLGLWGFVVTTALFLMNDVGTEWWKCVRTLAFKSVRFSKKPLLTYQKELSTLLCAYGRPAVYLPTAVHCLLYSKARCHGWLIRVLRGGCGLPLQESLSWRMSSWRRISKLCFHSKHLTFFLDIRVCVHGLVPHMEIIQV